MSTGQETVHQRQSPWRPGQSALQPSSCTAQSRTPNLERIKRYRCGAEKQVNAHESTGDRTRKLHRGFVIPPLGDRWFGADETARNSFRQRWRGRRPRRPGNADAYQRGRHLRTLCAKDSGQANESPTTVNHRPVMPKPCTGRPINAIYSKASLDSRSLALVG